MPPDLINDIVFATSDEPTGFVARARKVVRTVPLWDNKSEDQKRQEAAVKAGRACNTCQGTGTIGIGGRGAATSSECDKCGGSGMKKQ